jgi:hypothetical protein
MAVVVLADLAVETCAKAAFSIITPSPKAASRGSRLYLPEVLRELEKAWPRRPGLDPPGRTLFRDAANLHELRNLIQHDGTVPTDDEVTRQLQRAEAFCQRITNAFFEIELEEISRASLIQDEAVRARIGQAEESAARGDYPHAGASLPARSSWPVRRTGRARDGGACGLSTLTPNAWPARFSGGTTIERQGPAIARSRTDSRRSPGQSRHFTIGLKPWP